MPLQHLEIVHAQNLWICRPTFELCGQITENLIGRLVSGSFYGSDKLKNMDR